MESQDDLELCDEILELIEEIPEAGQEFAESVEEKVRSIRAYIEENGEATDAQFDALENMAAGIRKWLR